MMNATDIDGAEHGVNSHGWRYGVLFVVMAGLTVPLGIAARGRRHDGGVAV